MIHIPVENLARYAIPAPCYGAPMLTAVDTEIPLESRAPAGFRTQPHNIEAEQALLGAILINNEAYHRVSEFLRAEHFYEPVHGRIFATMHRLIESGRLADHVTLKVAFQDDEALRELDGAQYLARLARAAESIINAEDYGRLLHDLALKRGLIHVGEELVNKAYDASLPESGREQIETAEQRLFARLAVFVGGCTLQAAEAVCGSPDEHDLPVPEGLAALLGQSLLRLEEGFGGEPRFRMLETVREYALDWLAARPDAELTYCQHATFYLEIAEAAEQRRVGEEHCRVDDQQQSDRRGQRREGDVLAVVVHRLLGDVVDLGIFSAKPGPET